MATGAVSRYKRTTEPVINHVTQNIIASAGAESGCRDYQGHVLEIRKFKNRDKFLYFIVRVSNSDVWIIYLRLGQDHSSAML